MSLSHLKLSQLCILVAVADAGSFSEAALTLQRSQSAVSYAIATLEEELGVVLLSQGRYGSQLTPVGEQIVDRARQMMQLMEDMVRQANLAKGLMVDIYASLRFVVRGLISCLMFWLNTVGVIPRSPLLFENTTIAMRSKTISGEGAQILALPIYLSGLSSKFGH
jgi:molybdenum-dependent DNA-binding transcriptional regulator ModE